MKKDNFEFVVQKVTEIGANSIYPVLTDRTIKTNLNFDRLNKIIKEAGEQSGRIYFPNIFGITDLKKINIDKSILNIVFDISGESLLDNVDFFKKYENINIWVGPEGGWSDNEIKFFKEKKFKIFNLNKNILRAETAAILGIGFIKMIKE